MMNISPCVVSTLICGVPLEQIAQRLGDNSLAGFSRMFKKHRGVTPKQCPQRLQKRLF
ncbi:hypothetical protein NMR99_003682 [Vibrio navarrensis]|nr:hypothetical protein [Vibrio navarrensis]